MKITPADIELAERFPRKTSQYGYGGTMAQAKVSPQQLERLIKLNLVKEATNHICGTDNTSAKGWLRDYTTFICITNPPAHGRHDCF
jgi:hypothetical protein